MQNILIIDCDESRLMQRGQQLLMDGYKVAGGRSERDAQLKLAVGPDAVVLCDAGSAPQTIALLRQLRAGEIPRADPRVPVLYVGADGDSESARCYHAGADIALASGASPVLLAAGLKALATRADADQERRRILRVGSLCVDCDARVASIDEQPVALTRLEFDLLQTLASEPRRVFTRAELTRQVWGYDPAAAGTSRTLNTHASRLRKQLQAAGAEPLVQNVWGAGYRLTR